MALEVEDGTGKTNAESYASVAQADSRLSLHGYTSWATLSQGEKEQALRRATRAMVQIWRSSWKGDRLKSDQSLDWPRTDVEVEEAGGYTVASNVVPGTVVNACIDLAIKAAAGDLVPDVVGPRVKRKKLGPLEQEFSTTGPQSSTFRAAWLALAPLLNVTANSRVIR